VGRARAVYEKDDPIENSVEVDFDGHGLQGSDFEPSALIVAWQAGAEVGHTYPEFSDRSLRFYGLRLVGQRRSATGAVSGHLPPRWIPCSIGPWRAGPFT
jgi:hypothetical protein